MYSERSVETALRQQGKDPREDWFFYKVRRTIDAVLHRTPKNYLRVRTSDVPIPFFSDGESPILTTFTGADTYRHKALVAWVKRLQQIGQTPAEVNAQLEPFERAQDVLTQITEERNNEKNGRGLAVQMSDIAWVLHVYESTAHIAEWRDLLVVLREDLGLQRNELGKRMHKAKPTIQSFEERDVQYSGMQEIGEYVATGLEIPLRSHHGAAIALRIAKDQYTRDNGQEWTGAVASHEDVLNELKRIGRMGIVTYAEYIKLLLSQKTKEQTGYREFKRWTYTDIEKRSTISSDAVHSTLSRNVPNDHTFPQISFGLEFTPGSVETIVAGILAMEQGILFKRV